MVLMEVLFHLVEKKLMMLMWKHIYSIGLLIEETAWGRVETMDSGTVREGA